MLSFCVVYAVHGVFYTLTEKTFFAALSLTFRGNEASPFHAYSCILVPVAYVSASVFLTVFNHSCNLPLKRFSFTFV